MCSFFKKLFRTGATVAATVAAVKVADKVKANNPDGIKDVNGDGVVDYKDTLSEVKKAAGEVYHDTKDWVEKKKEAK